MAKGNWEFLHRSEAYIFYYRRAIPQLLRPAFGNQWEIKRSLKTRDKSTAILRHNQFNIEFEKIIHRAKSGEIVKKDLSALKVALEDRKKFVAEQNNHPKETLWSGITMLLRGKPIVDDDNNIIPPLTLTLGDENIIDPDGNCIDNMDVRIAISIANKQNIQKISGELEIQLLPKQNWNGFFVDVERKNFRSYDPKIKFVEGKSFTSPKPETNDSNLRPIPFSEMIELFVKFSRFKEEKTANSYRREYQYFIAINGDVLSTDITRHMLMSYRDTLEILPSNAKKRFPEKTLLEISKMQFSAREMMSESNVNKYTGRLHRMFEWAVERSYVGHLEKPHNL